MGNCRWAFLLAKVCSTNEGNPSSGPSGRGSRSRAVAEEAILQTEGLTKQFAGFFAVKDVAIKVRRGTIHALIGPNGAGKTTCFNLLTKFLAPSRGRISYKGHDI